MKFVLELGLSPLRAGSNRFGIVAVECPRGLGVVAAIFGNCLLLVGLAIYFYFLQFETRPRKNDAKQALLSSAITSWIVKERGGGVVQLWSILINTCYQERNAKRPAHDGFLPIRTLPEPQCQVANSLRTALDPQRLIVVKSMILAFDTSMLHHGPRVRLQSRHGTANMAVYLNDFLHA